MNRTLPSILVLIILLAACAAPGGEPGPSGASPSADPPTGGDGIAHPSGPDPVLTVEEVGGFAMVEMLAMQMPSFLLLGDGRVIMHGAQTLEYPGPALPPLIQRRLDEQGIQEILAAVEGTNLFTGDRDLRGASNVVVDATDTVFTLNAGGREVTVSVYGLGTLDPSMGTPPGVRPGELQAHETLSGLRDALMSLDTTLPAERWATDAWEPYEPDAFRLYVRDVTDQPMDAAAPPPQVREWPTGGDPAAFGDEQPGFGDGTRCAVVDGELGATWLEELRAAKQNTLWTDDADRRFSVHPRPLLPGEEPTCPELFGA